MAQGLAPAPPTPTPRPAGASQAAQGKCWERSVKTEMVPSRAEGRRGFDRLQRGDPAGLLQHRLLRRAVLGQPPDRPARRRSRAAQLRPDAVRHRPVPARLRRASAPSRTGSTTSGLLPDGAARPTSGSARGLASPRDLEVAARRRVLRRRGRAGPAGLRRELRALPFEPARPLRSRPTSSPTDPADPTLRIDWLGNDEIAPASEIGTYPARSLHSNHMQSRVWARVRLDRSSRAARPTRCGPRCCTAAAAATIATSRCSSAWAHAPFMHNNAIGPEICGKPRDPGARLLRLALRRRRPASRSPTRPTASPSIPSVEGRYTLYEASMQDLLEPRRRASQDVRARQRHRHRHRADG